MDERQQQIRERAGLEESRLNVELVEFLRKWSTPILLVIAAAALAFFGWQKLQQAQINKVNRAFAEFEAASEVAQPSPDSLKAVAVATRGVKGVPMLARLSAADAYLDAVRKGVVVGAMLKQDGGVEKPQDVLTDEQRAGYLKEAELLYGEVLAEAGTAEPQALYAVGAIFGMAAVSECRGDVDDARRKYESAETQAQAAGFGPLAEVARKRIENLPKIEKPVRMYAAAELPKLPWEMPPIPMPGAGDQPLQPLPPGAVPAQPESGVGSDAPKPAEEAPKPEGGEPKPPGDQPAPAPAPDQPK